MKNITAGVISVVIVVSTTVLISILINDNLISFFEGRLIMLSAVLVISILRLITEHPEKLGRTKGVAILLAVYLFVGLGVFRLADFFDILPNHSTELYWLMSWVAVIIVTDHVARKVAQHYIAQMNLRGQSSD